ncbi:MAG TPA: hypothetical protein VGS97_02750 [Actinocrinis sp.]|uniref:hypothetical protein n=1 Tax=Actinocrinis sp. TaxID=1920516 RepID=UPI002DDDAA0E|nr:hypothetical protein [Actinocrinis sp.]HEV2342990.1 hypothetical protein [Actinocrinis sp.]
MPASTSTLRDMIREALDNGATYRELEARAIDPVTGKTASRSVFIDTISGKLDRMPYEYHLRGVAAALRVPYERVRRAAINQWLPAEEDPVDAVINEWIPPEVDPAEAERLGAIEHVRRVRDAADRFLAHLDQLDQQEKERGTA